MSEFELVVQINGKLRGKILVSKDTEQTEIEEIAKNIENVATNLKDTNIRKVIYIKEKIINFVV